MAKKTLFVIDPTNLNPEVADWRSWQGMDFEIRGLSKEDARRAEATADAQIAENNITDPLTRARIGDQFYLDRLIKDWRGPVSPDRKKLELTALNKFALVNALPGLLTWLTQESADIARRHYLQLDGELGNSEPGPDGSQPAPGAKTAAS